MKRQLKKHSKNIRALFHMALHEQSKGNFKQALKWQKKYFKHAIVRNERWYVYFNRALCYLALNKCFKAFWAVAHAENETPGRWETDKLKGLVYFQKGKYAKAIESFVASFHINTGDQTYKPWKRDESGTWNLIGESYYRLRKYYKAHIAFGEAWKKCADPKNKKMLYDRHKLMYEIAKNQGRKS
jgi:tetratricopeptide (TPR) repeat protein